MKNMLCVWMMLIAGAVCAQTVLQDVPDATVVGPSNDPFLFSVIRGNAAYGTNALVVANAAKTTAVNASNRIVFAEGTINALASTQRVVVAQMGALVSTQAVQSVTISNAFSLGMAAWVKANEALDRPNGVDTNIVIGLSRGLVSAHNTNELAHEDIRASVSNAVDLASGAVKTNSVGGFAVGKYSTASDFSIAYGFNATASGAFSQAFGFLTKSSGLYSSAYGNNTISSGTYSFSAGQASTASGNYSIAIGNQSQALEDGSISLGFAAVSSNENAFTWSGFPPYYYSHGIGTFNINPLTGPSGFYIGETNLQTFLDARLSVTDFASSNAVTQARIDGLAVSNAVNANYISALEGSNAANFILSSYLYESNAVNVAAIDAKPSAESVTNAVFYKPIVSSVSAITSTVSVVPSASIYRLTATNSTTITFDTSALNTTNQMATWELWLNYNTTNAITIIWPSNVDWDYQTPDLTVTGQYKFACSKVDNDKIAMKQTYPTIYPETYVNVFVPSTLYPNSAVQVNPIGRYSLLDGTVSNRYFYVGIPVNLTDLIVKFKCHTFNQSAADVDIAYAIYPQGLTPAYTNSIKRVYDNPSNVPDSVYYLSSTTPNYQLSGVVFSARVTNTLANQGLSNGAQFDTLRWRKANELEKRAFAAGWRP